MGLLFGSLLAISSLLLAAGMMQWAMNFKAPLLDPQTLSLMVWTLLSATLLGGLSGGIGGSRLDRHPNWHIHLLPLFFILALSTEKHGGLRPFLLLIPIGLAHLLSVVLMWGWRRWSQALPSRSGWVVLGVGLIFGANLWQDHSESTIPSTQPNLLWVVFDTARADHLDGYPRATAPQLAELAQQGLLFEHAYAPAPWTLPSHASMLTGRYPRAHGCQDAHPFLDPTVPTLGEILRDNGYQKASFSSNPWVGTSTGLDRGFQFSFPAWSMPTFASWFPAALPILPRLTQDKGALAATASFSAWLPKQGPFFAFVNLLESHVPYHEIQNPSIFLPSSQLSQAIKISKRYADFFQVNPQNAPPSPEEVDVLKALYDAGLHADDQQLAALINVLRSRNLLENTLIVVDSDHGELFGEHGSWEHHLNLAEEVLHVPLVLSWPGKLPIQKRISDTISLVDLLPTRLVQVPARAKEIHPSIIAAL